MMDEFCITILFGQDQVRKFYNSEVFSESEITDHVKFYSFKTKIELDTFILGIEEATGWLDLIYLKGILPTFLMLSSDEIDNKNVHPELKSRNLNKC